MVVCPFISLHHTCGMNYSLMKHVLLNDGGTWLEIGTFRTLGGYEPISSPSFFLKTPYEGVEALLANRPV